MIILNYLVWESGTWKTQLFKKANISDDTMIINWLKDWIWELNEIANKVTRKDFNKNTILVDEYKKIVEDKWTSFIFWLVLYQLNNKDKNVYITFSCEKPEEIKAINKIVEKYLWDVKWNITEFME